MKAYTWVMVAHDADSNEPGKFRTPVDVCDWARTIDEFKGPREHFWVVTTDVRNNFIGYDAMSKGSQTGSLVHPREVFRAAVAEPACMAVILIHNHPSGDPTPSKEDKELTERMVQAGKILGIEVLDHVIITPTGNTYSLKERGLM